MHLLRECVAVAIISKSEDRQMPAGLNRALDEHLADSQIRYRAARLVPGEFSPPSD